jgi:hypothetical protein
MWRSLGLRLAALVWLDAKIQFQSFLLAVSAPSRIALNFSHTTLSYTSVR